VAPLHSNAHFLQGQLENPWNAAGRAPSAGGGPWGSALAWRAMELARRILGPLGRGIEIGAAAFNAFPGVRAWNVDYPGGAVFQKAQEALAGRVLPVDAWASAERLPVRAGALDFVLASHVIEHMPDTLAALREWDRALRVGGVCFLIVPHRERTFDAARPRTELEHHLADFALGTSAARDTMAPTSHYHVWITEDFVRLLGHLERERFLDWEVEALEDRDSKVGNGFTVVARKRAEAPPLSAPGPQPVAFHFARLALPFQVPLRSLDRVLPGAELPDPLPLERGTWRVTPIHGGFPPRAGETRAVSVGPPAPPPRIEQAVLEDTTLRIRGRDFHATTWLEARFTDGSVHFGLPEWEGGDLLLRLAGLFVPPSFELFAVNPPPGGGHSAPHLCRMP
jgi:SAM-dependent methyltransferase